MADDPIKLLNFSQKFTIAEGNAGEYTIDLSPSNPPAVALNDITDVTLTSPTTGQVLKYNGTEWTNQPDATGGGGAGATTLDGLDDVTITSPGNNHYLRYNGSGWVNAAFPTVPGVLNDFSDVTVSSPATGQVLAYNGTNWANAAPQLGFMGTTSVSGTTLTLSAAHHGNIIVTTGNAEVVVTLPNNIGPGFYCDFVQGGGGQISLVAASGATLQNRQGHSRTAGQFASMRLKAVSNAGGSAAVYNLSGDTGTAASTGGGGGGTTAWDWVGQSATTSSTSGNLVINEVSGAAAGDLIIVTISYRDAAQFTLPSSGLVWNLIGQTAPGNTTAGSTASAAAGLMAWAIHPGGTIAAANRTFIRSGGSVAIGHMQVYRSNTAGTITPTFARTTNAGKNGTAMNLGNLYTHASNQLVVAAVCGARTAGVSAFVGQAGGMTTASTTSGQVGSPTPGTWLERFDGEILTAPGVAIHHVDAIKASAGNAGRISCNLGVDNRPALLMAAFSPTTVSNPAPPSGTMWPTAVNPATYWPADYIAWGSWQRTTPAGNTGFGEWRALIPKNSWNYSADAFRDEIKFEVRSGDLYVNDANGYVDPNTSERAEMSEEFHPAVSSDMVVEWDSWIEFRNPSNGTMTSNTAPWCLFWQSKNDGSAISPPLEFYFTTDADSSTGQPNSWRIRTGSNNTGSEVHTTRYTGGNFPLGRWVKFRVEYRMQYQGTGSYLRVWMDGTQLLNLSGIPMGYSDQTVHRLRVGIYRSESPERMIHKFRNFVIA